MKPTVTRRHVLARKLYAPTGRPVIVYQNRLGSHAPSSIARAYPGSHPAWQDRLWTPAHSRLPSLTPSGSKVLV